MAERMLIVKVKRTTATQAELYGARHKYPDLKLFDLSELGTVGLGPAALTIGEDTPARFWAVYELSDKRNKAGNPYKDVIALEPMDKPATVTSSAVGDPAVLAELRAIHTLLEVLVQGQGLAVPVPDGESEQDLGDGDHGPRDDGGEPLAPGPGKREVVTQAPGALDRAFPRYQDGAAVKDNPAELAAYDAYHEATGQAPASVKALREWERSRRK